MKKVMLLALAFVFIIGLFAIGYAADEPGGLYIKDLPPVQIDRDEIPYKTKPINKLERGVINLATFWLEIPAEVAKVTKEQDPAAGVTIGVVNGVVTSVVRGATAIFDTTTFFVPSYTKPAMKPEYAWKAADDKIRALFW
jgi:putative exosortase-associated protein (TIGR04073 family)